MGGGVGTWRSADDGREVRHALSLAGSVDGALSMMVERSDMRCAWLLDAAAEGLHPRRQEG